MKLVVVGIDLLGQAKRSWQKDAGSTDFFVLSFCTWVYVCVCMCVYCQYNSKPFWLNFFDPNKVGKKSLWLIF